MAKDRIRQMGDAHREQARDRRRHNLKPLRVPATVRRVLLEDGREYAVPPRGLGWHRVEKAIIPHGGVAEILLLNAVPIGGDELRDVIEHLTRGENDGR